MPSFFSADPRSGWQDLFELQTANVLAAFPCTMLCILWSYSLPLKVQYFFPFVGGHKLT